MGGQCEAAFHERIDRRGATAPCRGLFRPLCPVSKDAKGLVPRGQLLPGWKNHVKTCPATFSPRLTPIVFYDLLRSVRVLFQRFQVTKVVSCVRRVFRRRRFVEA